MATTSLRAGIRWLFIILGAVAFCFFIVTQVRPFDAQRTYEVWNPRGTGGFEIVIPRGLTHQAIAGWAGDSRISLVVLRDRISELNEVLEDIDCPNFPSSTNNRTHIELWADAGSQYLTRYEMAVSAGHDLVPDVPRWIPKGNRLGSGHQYYAVLDRDQLGAPTQYAICLHGALPRSTETGACRVVFPIAPFVYSIALLKKVERAQWPEQIEAIGCLTRKTSRDISP